MTAPNFPNNPTIGQQFVVGNNTFQWDGEKWKALSNADNSLRSQLAAPGSTVLVGGVEAQKIIADINSLLNKNAKKIVYNGTNTVSDTAAIQSILDTMPANTNLVLNGPILIDNTLTIKTDNFIIQVNGTIKAAPNSDFEYMLFGTGRSKVAVVGGLFDANYLSRQSPKTIRRMGAGFSSCTECGFYRTVAIRAEGHNNIPGVGLVVAGASLRGFVINCYLQDCGSEGGSTAADGVFTSGTQNLLHNIVGNNCNDTLAVIESSNYSVMSNISGVNCSCVAAITNASADAKRGNIMCNITGLNWSASNTGGIQIGCPAETDGNLLDTIVSNVAMYAETGLGFGLGAAINIRNVGVGKAIGVTLDSIRINGAQNQGILCSGQDIEISNGHVKGTVDSCVQFQTGSTGEVTNMRLVGGSFGLLSAGTAEVISKINTIKNQTVAGFGVLGTSVIDSVMDINKASTKVAKDPGATFRQVGYNTTGNIATGNTLSAIPTGADLGGEPWYDQNGNLKGYVIIKALT